MIRILSLLLALATVAGAQSTAPSGKIPALNVNVTVGTAQRAEPGSFYRKTMNISPKFTVDGPGRMVPIPALEATMLIITMDTRAKYKDNVEEYKVYAAQTLPVPAAPTGERRQFAFDEARVSYDAYRDNSNVGGDVYKYYVFGLRDPETKALLDFKTNNPPLLTYIKAHPDKRDEILGHAKGAKFPAKFK